jgi:hypothetical protein
VCVTGGVHLYQDVSAVDFHINHHLQTAVALPVYVRQHSRVHDLRSHHCYASAQPEDLKNIFTMYKKQILLYINT